MKTRDLDALAKGPDPLSRVAVPATGQRCPRCHGRVARGRSLPCLLCAPHLVPVAFGGQLLERAS